jgi:hypothetical protein
VLFDDLHHAHHGRLHEIVALIGKPAGAEPADGSDQILAQLRVVDPGLRWKRSGPAVLEGFFERAV